MKKILFSLIFTTIALFSTSLVTAQEGSATTGKLRGSMILNKGWAFMPRYNTGEIHFTDLYFEKCNNTMFQFSMGSSTFGMYGDFFINSFTIDYEKTVAEDALLVNMTFPEKTKTLTMKGFIFGPYAGLRTRPPLNLDCRVMAGAGLTSSTIPEMKYIYQNSSHRIDKKFEYLLTWKLGAQVGRTFLDFIKIGVEAGFSLMERQDRSEKRAITGNFSVFAGIDFGH